METSKFYDLNTGYKMPALGLGTWKSSAGEVYGAVKYALKIGYQHIDGAAVYGNEEEVGKALRESLATKTIHRDDLFVVSKLWNDSHKKKDVIPALKKTLKDLNLDYLDGYLIHWPIASLKETGELIPESEAPLLETWQELEAAKEEGLIRSIGVSNFNIEKLEKIQKNAKHKISICQVESHPYLQQEQILDYCHKNNIIVTAYSPLGSKDRSESMKKRNEPLLLENPAIKIMAESRGVTPAQILIAWAIARNTVVIPKSVTPSRISENLKAQEIILQPGEMLKITELNMDFRYVDGRFFTKPGSPYTQEDLWG